MDDLTDILEHLIDESRLAVRPTMEQIKERADRRSQRRLPGRSVIVVPLVGIAAAALVVVLVLQILPATGQHPTSAAAAVLNEAASVAADLPPSQVPDPGQYLYYRTTQGSIQDSGAPLGERNFLLYSTETIDTWVAPDGSGRQRIVVAAPHLLYPADQSAWEAAGSPNYEVQSAGVFDTKFPSTTRIGGPLIEEVNGENYLAYPDDSRIPTDPSALKQYLNRYDHNSGPATAFLIAGDLLQEGASPALRSALFQVIEQLPGVKVLGPTKDEAGRPGLGVALDVGTGDRSVLVFNTKTSAVLGLKSLVGPSASVYGVPVPEGTLAGFTNFGPTGVVSSTSSFPSQ
jgi:hypothetical protein